MTMTSFVEFVTKTLDVLLVWLVLYYILKNLRRNVKMVLLFNNYNRCHSYKLLV